MSEPSLSKVLDAVEWAVRISPRAVKRFFVELGKQEYLARFRSLSPPERSRFVAALGGLRHLQSEFVAVLGRQVAVGKRLQPWMIEDFNRARGVVIDRGAVSALAQGYNLLPVGILGTVGDFDREEVVSILDEEGGHVGAGITAYSSSDIELIKGHHTSHLDELLPRIFGRAVMGVEVSR